MKFRYTGEAPDGRIEQYGVTFETGGVAEVTDETAIRKLQGNPFFEVVGAGESKPARGRRAAAAQPGEDLPRFLSQQADG